LARNLDCGSKGTIDLRSIGMVTRKQQVTQQSLELRLKYFCARFTFSA